MQGCLKAPDTAAVLPDYVEPAVTTEVVFNCNSMSTAHPPLLLVPHLLGHLLLVGSLLLLFHLLLCLLLFCSMRFRILHGVVLQAKAST